MKDGFEMSPAFWRDIFLCKSFLDDYLPELIFAALLRRGFQPLRFQKVGPFV